MKMSNKFMKVTLAGATLVALALAGCGTTTSTSAAPTEKTTTPSIAAIKQTHYEMTMLTGGMIGKKGWPQFTPANLTLPANKDITITVRNFDDGNAKIPAGNNVVKGTVDGSITVDGKTVKSVPTADVAHTITISSIGLNIPIPVITKGEKSNVVVFKFHTPSKPTKLNWQCTAACGTGSSGWEGAMVTNGFMKGTWTIQ